MIGTSLTPQIRNKPIFAQEVAFLIVHLLPLAAIFTETTLFDWMVCIFFYLFRMFWITGGYHRYFAHKSYKTSRWFQFVIAFMAQSSAQKGALWWAAHHRRLDDETLLGRPLRMAGREREPVDVGRVCDHRRLLRRDRVRQLGHLVGARADRRLGSARGPQVLRVVA